jgi:hypothetical protein
VPKIVVRLVTEISDAMQLPRAGRARRASKPNAAYKQGLLHRDLFWNLKGQVLLQYGITLKAHIVIAHANWALGIPLDVAAVSQFSCRRRRVWQPQGQEQKDPTKGEMLVMMACLTESPLLRLDDRESLRVLVGPWIAEKRRLSTKIGLHRFKIGL